ncbi:hypothetical protein BV25DRAFT_1917192 [Artomyces pyxidatus]|uniref:Uncharacterized protein n=1 Tax=Artomyces pyxidatus TaxID=48021 RepID=A0ACB8SYK1_9AGAM|nr:hypothetical protein BV25DRAFT_1917192 [Artomyces pyxidatus]
MARPSRSNSRKPAARRVSRKRNNQAALDSNAGTDNVVDGSLNNAVQRLSITPDPDDVAPMDGVVETFVASDTSLDEDVEIPDQDASVETRAQVNVSPSQAEVDSLKAQLAAVQARLALAEQQAAGAAGVVMAPVMIPRPKSGTAGDGFNLQHEMGLDDDRSMYRGILRGIRHLVAAAQLDHTLRWRHQDKQRLGRLFKVVRRAYSAEQC